MSIPLDRLYHYIETIANATHGGDTVIYRFYPHGSKNIDDLQPLRPLTVTQHVVWPEIYCNDQEPLNFELYQDVIAGVGLPSLQRKLLEDKVNLPKWNLRKGIGNIHDRCLLLHSEQRSHQVELYSQRHFIPVYYWSHALIALDWFRFAQHVDFAQLKDSSKLFLVYNRAWSGTRQYRLKFADLLVDNNLVQHCATSLAFVEPQTNLHYSQLAVEHAFWQPQNRLEDHFKQNETTSCYSADFDVNDYVGTDIEVVLETLFCDGRLHLTEKSLRPIACGQPFLLAAPAGSLKYLRDYGFQTFGDIFNEDYDNITNHQQRLQAIVDTMKQISQWSGDERHRKLLRLKEIAQYNKQHFFSEEFYNKVVGELKTNLTQAFGQLQNDSHSFFLNSLPDILKQAPAIVQHFPEIQHELDRRLTP